MSSTQAINRSKLYQLVWQEPMSRPAASFGLSDVGLAKVCRKHDIPCPPRGYWAKKQHGQKPSQIPLPNRDDDPLLELNDPSDPVAVEVAERQAAIKKVVGDEQSSDAIHVAESLRGAHDLVSRANQELQSARTGEMGLIIVPAGRTLEVTTSKASLRRAMLIMDALIKALEKRSYKVDAGPAVTIFE